MAGDALAGAGDGCGALPIATATAVGGAAQPPQDASDARSTGSSTSAAPASSAGDPSADRCVCCGRCTQAAAQRYHIACAQALILVRRARRGDAVRRRHPAALAPSRCRCVDLRLRFMVASTPARQFLADHHTWCQRRDKCLACSLHAAGTVRPMGIPPAAGTSTPGMVAATAPLNLVARMSAALTTDVKDDPRDAASTSGDVALVARHAAAAVASAVHGALGASAPEVIHAAVDVVELLGVSHGESFEARAAFSAAMHVAGAVAEQACNAALTHEPAAAFAAAIGPAVEAAQARVAACHELRGPLPWSGQLATTHECSACDRSVTHVVAFEILPVTVSSGMSFAAGLRAAFTRRALHSVTCACRATSTTTAFNSLARFLRCCTSTAAATVTISPCRSTL